MGATHYLDKAEFTAHFTTRHQHAQAIADLEHRITLGFRLIVDGVAHKLRWRTEDDREDAVQTATANLIPKIGKFDATRPDANAFGFFSTCARRELLACIARQKKEREGQSAQLADPGTADTAAEAVEACDTIDALRASGYGPLIDQILRKSAKRKNGNLKMPVLAKRLRMTTAELKDELEGARTVAAGA